MSTSFYYAAESDLKLLKTSEFLNYVQIGDTGKTIIVGVGNHSGVKLGQIKWVGAWRKYCFFPECEVFFDNKCLVDIIAFTEDLMNGRRKR